MRHPNIMLDSNIRVHKILFLNTGRVSKTVKHADMLETGEALQQMANVVIRPSAQH